MADDEKLTREQKKQREMFGKMLDAPQQDNAGTRYTRNLSPAAKKRVMDRAKIIDKLLENEDEDDGE